MLRVARFLSGYLRAPNSLAQTEIDVPLGAQRDRSVRETPEFGRLITELRRLLEGRDQSAAAH